MVNNWGFPQAISVGSVKHVDRKSFAQYAEAARRRLGLVSTDSVRDGAIDAPSAEQEQMLGQWREYLCFYILRLCLAPVLESLLLIDRLLFLNEQHEGEGGGDTALLPLFDPWISPRNFVLIGRRRGIGNTITAATTSSAATGVEHGKLTTSPI